MLNELRKPHTDLGTLILRLGLGFVFIAHGYVKLNLGRTLSEQLTLTQQQILGWTELTCGALLLLGLLTRLAALVLIVDMVGAIAMVTGIRGFIDPDLGPHGFRYRAGGFEYNLVIIAGCLALVALGSGWFSLDHLIFDRRRRPVAPVPPAPSLEPTPAGTPAP